jgi:hypothetical protein
MRATGKSRQGWVIASAALLNIANLLNCIFFFFFFGIALDRRRLCVALTDPETLPIDVFVQPSNQRCPQAE